MQRVAIDSVEWFPVYVIEDDAEQVAAMERDAGVTVLDVSDKWLDQRQKLFDKFYALQRELEGMCNAEALADTEGYSLGNVA